MDKIEGGATIWARQTIDSAIFYQKPDKWFKIWFYIVNRVNYRDNKRFEKGSCLLKYKWIMSATGATKDQIKHCIKFLKQSSMLATQKATRGFYVEVLKYNYYQDLNNYKSHTESHIKATQEPHSYLKKLKNVKNNTYSLFKLWNSLEITIHKNLKKFEPNLRAALESYSVANIQEAMKNYAKILHSEDYFWNYRYKLDDFLTRKGNIDRFLTINKPFENFKETKTEGKIDIQPEDRKKLSQAKVELSRLSSEEKIFNWLQEITPSLHFELKKFLDRTYPRRHSYEEAKERYEEGRKATK